MCYNLYMQYPVPQFTDVEDKIIGPLTLKQFGIIFGVGIIVFLAFSATKSILVAIFAFVLFGLPGLALAFAPFNGRPVYSSIGNFIKFFTGPKELVFHKEAGSLSAAHNLKDAQIQQSSPWPAQTAQESKNKLEKVQQLLKDTATEEQRITELRIRN